LVGVKLTADLFLVQILVYGAMISAIYAKAYLGM
jgi:hypothetical protein